MLKRTLAIVAAGVAIATASMTTTASAATATWDAFVVRNSSGGTAPLITKNGTNGVTASIWLSSQKAAFGTDYFNGTSLSSVKSLNYTRTDVATTTTSPYVNIWVTDGTNYAVIAPHSRTIGGNAPGFGGSVGDPSGNNVNGLSLQTLGFSVYENSDGNDYSWIFPNAVRPNGTGVLVDSSNTNAVITLAEIGTLTVQNPNDVLGSGWTGGTGAAKGSNGFVVMFGEPQIDNGGNAVPYVLENVSVAAPTPATLPAGLALLALCSLGLLIHRRRHAA